MILSLGCALMAVWPLARARAQELDAATKARIEKAERGPATIDVSKYPEKIQEYYQIFSQKCTQCHKLSRPINSDYAVPDEWSRYIKRMFHKPGSNISSSQAKKIFDFLVYDSSVRKKATLDEKLAKLSPKEKKAAEDKIAEIHEQFDKK
jgi:cytochrome c1